MRILHIINNNTFNIYCRTISDLVCALKSQGVDQRIFCNKENSKILFSGIQTSVIQFNKNIFGFTSKSSVVEKYKPDLIITWGLPAREFIGDAKSLHISFVESISDMQSFDNCDYIFTNSESILHFLKSNGWSGNKSFYLPPFVSEKTSAGIAKKNLYIPERSKVIFSSAGFYNAINFTPLFYAVSSIPELYLILSGHGTDMKEISDIAMEIGVKPRIRFVELSENVPSLIRISEFSIFPFFDIEIQKSIITSFQNKSLVITEKNYLTSEIVSDKENAIILHSNNYSNIADVIQTNLTDKLLHREIVENARKDYEEKYSETAAIKQYLDVFKNLISSYGASNNF